MATVVVDTCVVSFLFKRDSRAQLYRPHLTGNTLVISFVTLAELYRWPLERSWSLDRRDTLEEHLSDYVDTPSIELCAKRGPKLPIRLTVREIESRRVMIGLRPRHSCTTFH